MPEKSLGELKAQYASNPDSLTVAELKALGELRKLNPQGDERWYVSGVEASELLGCTQDNVSKLKANGKLQVYARGKLDIRDICRHLRESKDARKAEPDELREAQARYREAKARLAEIEVSIAEGRLLSADEINRAMAIAGIQFRDGLMGWAVSMPKLFARKGTKEIARLLRAEAEKLLRQLSEQLGNVSGPSGEKPEGA